VSATRNCPGCGSNPCERFYELAGAPTNSGWLSPSRNEAIALPRGTIALEFCQMCGLVFNGAFDPRLADTGLHEAIDAGSRAVKAFQKHLAAQLIERYALRGKNILEIGGGQGELLDLLCKLGGNCRIAFDARSPPPSQRNGATRGHELLSEHATGTRCDLVCSRNFLQTVAEPAQLLKLLRRELHCDARLFLQLSNFMRTLRNLAFWEIHYPNRSYFTPGTLHRLLRAQGFAVGDVWTDFEAEYLMADARAAAHGATDSSPGNGIESIAELAGLVARFADACREKQAMWCEILRKLAGNGNRIAIWGAGCDAASFLATLAVGDEVSYVVDVNRRRRGKFTAGTGHRIVAPGDIGSMRPDVVIVMNSVLTSEIRERLASAGCTPTLLIA
jgi:C-methyltransferase C-terminal domain/Methyltransferase domain